MTARRGLISALPLTVSEADFKRTVIAAAISYGWRVHHTKPARVGKVFITPVEGHPGLPDLILARAGQVLLAELKRHGARPSPDQRLWLAALGSNARLWRPGDWAAIVAELRDGPVAA